MFTTLKSAVAARRVRNAELAAYRKLLMGGEHILRDIGVTEGDVRAAMGETLGRRG